MSHGNYNPYGQPPPVPKQGMSTGAKIGVGCFGCFGTAVFGFIFLAIAGALLPSSSDDDGGETTVATSPEAAEAADADEADEFADEDEAEAEPEETHPGLGDTIEHGDWEITVHSIDYDVSTAELSEFFADEPSGQWVTVDMTVKNLGSGPDSFSGRDQVLMDDGGSMYRYDLWASHLFGSDLNPGSEDSGTLAFDVPDDFEADHMFVNGESSYADGVRVELD